MSGENRSIAIVGGGLVGSLLSIFLSRRGFRVDVYEQRPDLRSSDGEAGRSINLVLTSRGIEALGRVGLAADVEALTVPVLGRMMHSLEGELAYQPYGRDDSERNYSISRSGLNRFLVSAAERRGVRFHFHTRLVAADLAGGKLTFGDHDGSTETAARIVIGADGGGSALRAEMVRQNVCKESVAFLDHGYKELAIPAAADGSFRIRHDALHIWPRGELMLMALPNVDGTFTVTLYLPYVGAVSFDSLDTQQKVRDFFEEQFADAAPLIPDYAASYFINPTGNLGTVRCAPWNHGGQALLIGDAAHGIVPFFGQGMNCGFEDCSVLDDLLDRHGADLETVFETLGQTRKPDSDAIADMAIENFVEMRDLVGDERFLLRKRVEHRLEREFLREYRSRYSMVMYSSIPYSMARQVGEIQQSILDALCAGLDAAENLDLPAARGLIAEKLTPFLARHRVSLDY